MIAADWATCSLRVTAAWPVSLGRVSARSPEGKSKPVVSGRRGGTGPLLLLLVVVVVVVGGERG